MFTVVLAAFLSLAQAPPPALTGRVVFANVPVPGAVVTAARGAKTVTATTDDGGVFQLAALDPGTWTVRVEMRGFAALSRDVIVPPAGPVDPMLTMQALKIEQCHDLLQQLAEVPDAARLQIIGAGMAGSVHYVPWLLEQMVSDHHIDRTRIFVTGLSAGGAMTLAMLASYPEVFAAGAVIAGLPYGTATNAQEAMRGMFKAPPKSSRELGDLVREASPNTAVWPRLSVWHGSADQTVKPSNAGEIIKQWLDVHGLPLNPMSEQIVDGQSRQVWWNTEGKTVIESFTIADMAHGTPLSSLGCGIAGPFMIDAGISSSDHIAKFFGLNELRLRRQLKRLSDEFRFSLPREKLYAPPQSRRASLAGCER